MLQHVRVLVAGVGNVLRGDDGFGVVVAQRLLEEPLPPEVEVLDVGIGGIHLVQELLDPVDALVILDATELGRPAGAVAVVRPDVRDPTGPDDLADMHYATPERALMLARALNVLPERVWIVGCQPENAERLGEGLSPAAAAAVEPAVAEVKRLVTSVLETA
jgi:hydrogenase maturation protease